jgi:1,2-diacylglycerol 3-alpha-glucosyltransferase
LNIVMMTNTYAPHVGGVARSVESFARGLRSRRHSVLVVAPVFEHAPVGERRVIRVPAIQNFNGSDFSVSLPIPGFVSSALDELGPELVHSHHPFLLGDTAVRIAKSRRLPLIFTHHTLYERYTHYVPADSAGLQRFVIRLATEYANLCDHVIAPSESAAKLLKERGVKKPLTVIPSGIDIQKFEQGDGRAARRRYNIPANAFLVGHVGRLAPEKNLAFLGNAVAQFLNRADNAHFLVVGTGPVDTEIQAIFAARGLADRLHVAGILKDAALADAYQAMDVFAFASQAETQGMVLAEAMAASVPVVAVDASGVCDLVRNGVNGRLMPWENTLAYADALEHLYGASEDERKALGWAARRTAEHYARERCVEQLEAVYRNQLQHNRLPPERDVKLLVQTRRLLAAEWKLWTARMEAAKGLLQINALNPRK